ncbi:MAG: hypothetical protein ABSF24_03480 [Candidatus Bathyarchaeia archaeon]
MCAVWIKVDVAYYGLALTFVGIFINVKKSGIVWQLGEPFRVNIMKNRLNTKLDRQSVWKGVND